MSAACRSAEIDFPHLHALDRRVLLKVIGARRISCPVQWRRRHCRTESTC
jgi:hypothetical protein